MTFPQLVATTTTSPATATTTTTANQSIFDSIDEKKMALRERKSRSGRMKKFTTYSAEKQNQKTIISTTCHQYLTILSTLLFALLLTQLAVVESNGSNSIKKSSSPIRYQPQLYTFLTSDDLEPSSKKEQHFPISKSGNQISWNNRQLAARQLVLNSDDDENNFYSHANNHDQVESSLRGQKLLSTNNFYNNQFSDANEVVQINRWPAAATVPAVKRGTNNAKRTSSTTKTSRRRSPVGANGTKRTLSSSSSPSSSSPKSPVSLGFAGGRKGVAQSPPLELPSIAQDGSTINATTTTSTGKRNYGTANKRKNLVCYYGTWAVYRPDAGKFAVENIDPFLCTHVIYGFTGLSFDNLIKPLDPWNDLEDNYGKGAMKRFTNLKRLNPELKTLVAIGGWNEGSIKYSKMASEPEARAKFVDSVVKFLAKYNFDGLDLDWEYPGSRGGSSYDKQNFVRLLRELHDAFQPHGYLLTAAVSAGKWFIDPAYDIAQVSKYLDLINLMAYDYHGAWETKTGMNAPLFSSKQYDLSKEDRQLNVNWSVNYWLSQGAAREKLMLGVGSYGRSFTLDRENENGINAPASQKGRAGPYTREPGSLGYNEICEQLERGANSWTIVRDPDYLAPYAFTNNGERQWVGYDDKQSLALKAEYAKSMGLGGMMMWSIETDDFQGRCNGGEKFPLLNTIKRVLDGSGSGINVAPSTTSTSTSASYSTTTTTARPVQPPKPTTGRPGHEIEEVDEQQRPTTSTSRPRPRPTTSTRRPIVIAPTTSTSTKRPPSSSPRPTQQPVSTTTTTTAQPYRPPQPNQAEFTCQSDGMFADPNNCRKFIRCIGSGTNFPQRFTFDCGPGTAFSEQLQACDHIYNVANCNRRATVSNESEHNRQLAVVTTMNNNNNNSNNDDGLAPPTPDNHQRFHYRNRQQQHQLMLVPAPLSPSQHHLIRLATMHHFYPQIQTALLQRPMQPVGFVLPMHH